MKNDIAEAASIDSFLDLVRHRIETTAPELSELFKTFSGEAKFGRRFIEENLKKLPIGAEILEVGAGSMLLSCQLQREGFRVTALEPLSEGFDHFKQLQDLVLWVARDNDWLLHYSQQAARASQSRRNVAQGDDFGAHHGHRNRGTRGCRSQVGGSRLRP